MYQVVINQNVGLISREQQLLTVKMAIYVATCPQWTNNALKPQLLQNDKWRSDSLSLSSWLILMYVHEREH